MAHDFDAAVVGGGVVGLATARRLAMAGLETVLLERHDAPGREVSSRNSEVIHGGMYYISGSLKARLCVAGRRLLYSYCEKRGVAHRRCGKVIVAVDAAEEAALGRIADTGRANGVEGLCWLAGGDIEAVAPGIRAVAALYSPETGVISAHGLMDALAADATASGAMLVMDATVNQLARDGDGWKVGFANAGEQVELTAGSVVNAGGLGAQAVMAMAGLNPETAGLRLYPCKGRYFSVQGPSRKRIGGLVYPAPETNLAGLGVHTVVDVGGGVKLGPDVCYIEPADDYDYTVDEAAGNAFFAGASRYLPFLRRQDIFPDMAGVRPKLAGPGQPARDFHIAMEAERGLPGFVNLAGIESPGLTACLAIADMIMKMLAPDGTSEDIKRASTPGEHPASRRKRG